MIAKTATILTVSERFSMCKYKFFAISTLTALMHINAFAGYELVCAGQSPRSNHKAVVVDCSNRKAVIDALQSAWSTLRGQGIGGTAEDMCWKPYSKAKELHPSIQMQGIAGTFFMQCNTSLQYAN